jgi:hypothetical protein
MTRVSKRLRVERLDDRLAPAVFGNVWPNPTLTISFVPDGTDVNGVASRLGSVFSGIDSSVWQGEILRAAQTWAEAAGINFAVVPDGGQPIGTAGNPQHDKRFGDIRIAAVPIADELALGIPFDLAAGTRAGDFWLSSSIAYSLTSPAGFDLYSVALHELGHSLGLGGSPNPSSAMYQQISLTPRIGLSAEDITAVRTKYGVRQADIFEGLTGNETIPTATELDRGGHGVPSDWIIANADLHHASDRDVFEFRAKDLKGGGLIIDLKTAGHSLLTPQMEILNPQGTILATASGANGISLTLATAIENATYYARVTSSQTGTFSIGAYEITVRPELSESDAPDDHDLYDPEVGEDDSPETAFSPVQNFPDAGERVDYILEASLSASSDIDFYRIRAPRTTNGSPVGAMTVVVWAGNPTLIDPVLTVIDELGHTIPATMLAHDGGSFVIQIASVASDQRIFVSVRHSSFGPVPGVGNYFLAVKFGDAVTPLQEIASGFLSPLSPVSSRQITVDTTQVFHAVVTAGDATPASGVRFSILDEMERTVDTRFANRGETISFNTFLPAGTYRFLVAGGTLDGSAMPTIAYRVSGFSLSDPIGPQRVDPTSPPPTSPPPPPPPANIGPGTPMSPVVPVAPTGPQWWVTPPTDWPAPPSTALQSTRPPAPAIRTFSVGGTNGVGIKSFNPDGTIRFAFNPFPSFTGELRVAEADLTGDGIADLIVGVGPGRTTAVRVYDGSTSTIILDIQPFEFSFTGGVYVAAGDITGDGKAELVVTPDEGGGPRVRVYSGGIFTSMADFYGIDDPNFRGGARAAVGDLDGDGIGDLTVAAGFGGGPRVAAFAGPSIVAGFPRKLFGDFFLFEPTLRNGIFVASGDVNGDGYSDLIAGGGPRGGPRVFVLDGQSLVHSAGDTRTPLANFFSGDASGRGGIRVGAKDINADGRSDVLTGSGSGIGSRLTAFDSANLSPFTQPPMLIDEDAFPGLFGGVFVN